jgi:hypothetical protein
MRKVATFTRETDEVEHASLPFTITFYHQTYPTTTKLIATPNTTLSLFLLKINFQPELQAIL